MIRKVYTAIGNDRELSPAVYPPKLIRRISRNNAGQGEREVGQFKAFAISSFFFFKENLPLAMYYARPTFSGISERKK